MDENYFRDDIFTKEEALKMLESVIIEAYKRKGSFNINSKLSNVYAQNYYSEGKYYKDSNENQYDIYDKDNKLKPEMYKSSVTNIYQAIIKYNYPCMPFKN